MSDSTDDRDRFLHEIRKAAYSDEPFPLIALGVDGPLMAIVYRESATGPLLGRFYDYATLARQFDGASPELIADAVVVGDLLDPSGVGVSYHFPWEPELINSEESILWIGEVFTNSMMKTWGSK
ncbi:hypothetical protein EDF60_1256 [Leucobacter luti]|uniref:hypothetical protein n=1 Tax=Leucobacter luti TaxID=340320 RepID=UPI0010490720|nr:hypothetical protein [Leucobacter luti]MCW2287820.1 hypothetical protein [Leucobacter luti]TCK46017.1 hypothetical protein EDF60_1256 [Leucobacter luti]